jgi:hypothetical protein
MFPDEKGFWERCGELLIDTEKFSEAAEIYDHLFKIDPFSLNYLQNYVNCLKKSFKFDHLESLKSELEEIGWLTKEQIKIFDWRSDFPSLLVFDGEKGHDGPKELEPLIIPFRELNWTNYASTLHAMATGNYTKIYKKQPFNPDNYSVLNGPCVIELHLNLHASGVVNTQQNTQNLINSLHDYSASSMEEISKKRSLRRKETRATQSMTSKSDLTPADLVKIIKSLLNFEEQEIVDILCSTERSCLQLLDKNNLVIDADDNSSMESENIFNTFTLESLQQRINSDNETKKSICQRIFELVTFFFVDSLKTAPNFPQSLARPMADLWHLFKTGALSIDALNEITQFTDLLTSVCEILISLKEEINYELALLKHYNSNNSSYRLRLLECLINENEEIRDKTLEELAQELIKNDAAALNTRHFNPLPALITSEELTHAISIMKQSKIIENAEELFSQDKLTEAIELFGSPENLNNLIKTSSGEIKLRLAKLSSTPCDSIISEFLAVYPQLEISRFIEYLTAFLPSVKELTNTEKCTLLCIFWNIYSCKQLIVNHILLNALFAMLLEKIIPGANLDVCRFLLNWMSQEKCFGSASGLVPLKIFCQFATSTDFAEMKFAYSTAFSLFRFPNIFAVMDPERGLEDWDRSPIGLGTRDIPCPNLNELEFNNLALLIHYIDEKIDSIEDTSNVVISEPGFVSFVDWLNRQFAELAVIQSGKHFFYCLNLNRNHIRAFLNCSLEFHAQKQVLAPPRGHFSLEENFESFRYLLNTRSDIVYSELQGRKKSFEILKKIRSDLKTSLSISVSDGDVWKLLGLAYHDAAIHFMSSDAEFLIQNSAKLKRCIKKAILCLKQALKIDQSDRESWTKLMDLADWALHEPSLLSTDPEIVKFICSIGCTCIQQLLSGAAARDRWILFLRLELFLRKSGSLSDPLKQLELLKEASQAACSAYSENVYESTALFMSLVKFYSRLSKLRMNGTGTLTEEQISFFICDLNLPASLKIEAPAESGDILLYQYMEALHVLDRKRIFHSHVTALAWHSSRVLNDQHCALNHLQQLFPFLKSSKKSTSVSLLQIYQCDHERPARFLVAGKRYLLQLLCFIEQSNLPDLDKPEILTQFLKKLHYIRKTILGFPEILTKATLVYLNLPHPDKEIVDELIGSIKSVFNNKIPNEIKLKLAEQE